MRAGWRAAHRFSGCCPRFAEAVVPVWGRPDRPVPGGLVSGSSGVVLGDGEAEGFEFGDELAQAAVVVELGGVVGELVIGQDVGLRSFLVPGWLPVQ